MKKYLNTLFVTTQKAYLFKDGESVVVKVENENRLRLPIHTLDGIICFGAVLSFIYTLLVHDCRSALEGVGLDPYVGFLHTDRPGRPSLALDLMEEFRAFLADRLTLSLINRQQLKQTDFRESESGAVLLNEDGRKKVLVGWQKRKQDEITHPYTGEKMPIGLLPHIQAQLLARHIRGEMDGYPPFIWK